MNGSDCAACAFRRDRPVREVCGQFVPEHTPAQRRLAARRAEQATQAFRGNYQIRAGGESVNSGLKRGAGLGRLRTRGLQRVRMAAMFRCAGWNVFRALAALKKRGIRNFAAVAAAFSRLIGLAAHHPARSAARGGHLSFFPYGISERRLALAA
jgi:hypothetical protein